jgi:hypothetical protein
MCIFARRNRIIIAFTLERGRGRVFVHGRGRFNAGFRVWMCVVIGGGVRHFDVWWRAVVRGSGGGGVRVGGGGTSLGFLSLALLVLYNGFVKVILGEGFDGLLVFLADRGWICDAVFFVVAFHELLGDLEELLDIADCKTKGM